MLFISSPLDLNEGGPSEPEPGSPSELGGLLAAGLSPQNTSGLPDTGAEETSHNTLVEKAKTLFKGSNETHLLNAYFGQNARKMTKIKTHGPCLLMLLNYNVRRQADARINNTTAFARS